MSDKLKMLAKGVFRLNKKHFLVPLISLTFGLVGCADNDESAVQNRNSENVQPFGYYSNEDHNNGGNVRILDDNDGPVTEIMDHSFGAEGVNERNQRTKVLENGDVNGNPANPTKPLSTYDRNFLQRDNRFSTSDVNYHGHLDNKESRIRSANDTVYDVNLANKLDAQAAKVANVQGVHSLVYQNSVIIAVDLANITNEQETRQKIRQAVQPYVKGRSVTVVSDEGTFTRIRDINNNIENGRLREGFDVNLRRITESNQNQTR